MSTPQGTTSQQTNGVERPEIVQDSENSPVSTSSKPDHASIEISVAVAPQEKTDPAAGDTKTDSLEGYIARQEKREKRFNDTLNTSHSECYKILKGYDDATIKGWKEEIDTLLVFAGLFSAVVTTFTVQTYPALYPPSPDPSVAILAQISAQLSGLQINGQSITSTVPSAQNPATYSSASASMIVVNILWFTSLILSLVSAAIGILLKQWLREYEIVMTNASDHKLRVRQLRHDGLVRWQVKELVMLLPLLLQIALMMFLIGLVELAWTLNPIVAVFVTTFVSVTLAFIIITTILPAVVLACPYKSPQSRLFFHLWQWSKSSFRVASGALYNTVSSFSWHTQESTKPSSYVFLHDWSQWEDLYIKRSSFVLDARVLQAVKTAYVGVTSQTLYTTMGPIAVNALGTNKYELSVSECPSGESAMSLHEHLDAAEEYCDYSQESSIPVQEDLLHCLARLLRWGRFQKRSWSMIRQHGYRFNIDVQPLLDLLPIVRFFNKHISDVSTASLDIESIGGSIAVIQLATRIPDHWFKHVQDELRQFLEFLSPHIHHVSKFASGDWRQGHDTTGFLKEFFHNILELAQKHDDVVTIEFVRACEDGFKGLDETFANYGYWQYKKPGVEKTLQAIRKLVEEQQAAMDSEYYDSFST